VEIDRETMLESLGPARRFADPAASPRARTAAARGALPIPPDQLACVLAVLTEDEDAEIRAQATQSLLALPSAGLESALDAELHPGILELLARALREHEGYLEKLAVNRATADETFCFLASLPHSRVVEIASNNQVRLQRCPALVETLGENPVTSQAAIDRMLDFLGVRTPKDDGEEDAPDEVEATPPSDLPPVLLEDPEADERPTEDAAKLDDEEQRSLHAIIGEMTVVEKVKLARFGNKEARAILMRDSNRLVAMAAVNSPKITDSEVVAVAQSRSLSEDVLRHVASNREWTKNYQVKLAITTNPKAPLAAAIKFLNYLTDRDLKTIMRSRDVPGPVVQQARRILIRKGKA